MKTLTNILFGLLMTHTAHGVITGKPWCPPDAVMVWLVPGLLILGVSIWLSDHVAELTGIALALAPPPPKLWAVCVSGIVLSVPFFGDYLLPIAGLARPWEWTSLLFWGLFAIVAAYAISPPWKTPNLRSPR